MKYVLLLLVTLASCMLQTIQNPNITLEDLQGDPHTFADSTVSVQDVYIASTKSLINFSLSTVTDRSGVKMTLLSNKPFRTGQKATLRVRLLALNGDHYVLIENKFRPVSNLISQIEKFI